MASGIWERLRRVQKRVSKPIGFNLSRLLFPFKGPDELANVWLLPTSLFNKLTAPLRPPNIPAAAPTDPEALPRIYSNENLQDIIWAVIKARLMAAKNTCEHPLKARFLYVYRNNNYMACYTFYQQCKNYFTTVKAKVSNRIPFVAFFLPNLINFH